MPNDTVIKVYRPAFFWNSSYVSWNKRCKGIAWKNAEGNWYDINGVLQGNMPYSTLTLKGNALFLMSSTRFSNQYFTLL